MAMKKLYLFYPSRMTGGAEYLLKRVAEMAYPEYYLTIIDYTDGWLARHINLPLDAFNIITFTDSQKIKIPDDAILLTPSSNLRHLDLYFESSGARLLFWTIQPYNILPIFPLFRSIQRKYATAYLRFRYSVLFFEFSRYKKLLQNAIAKHSIYAMDEESDQVLKDYFDLSYSGYLPITIDQSKFLQPIIPFKVVDELQIVWLGRLDLEFKYFILEKIVKDLNDYAGRNNKKILFKIIGDGPGKAGISDLAEKMGHITVRFYGELHEEHLNEVLTGCLFAVAMGTSAIETSARHIPTILLDFSYGLVSDLYQYRWFYESQNYTLGRHINRFADPSCGNLLKIDDVFSMVLKNRELLVNRCFDYGVNFHSSEAFKPLLFDALENSQLKISDLYHLGVARKPIWLMLKQSILRLFK